MKRNSLWLMLFIGGLMGSLLYAKYGRDGHNITQLQIKNGSSTDTVTVYLTLSGGADFVSDVNGIFGIKSDNKLQGSFQLNPNDSLSYACPSDKAISGNISFWNPPLNCPYAGTTLYEFTLNNSGTVEKAQETVDISCVAGVTSIGSISFSGGGNWTDNVNNDSVTYIRNKELYQNTGLSGVFPYGCTNCTNTQGAPDCTGHPDYATPNTNKLCNVQRNAEQSGGKVTITYYSRSK